MTDTTGNTPQLPKPAASKVAAAQSLLRLTAEDGEMPEPRLFELASHQDVHRMQREDAQLVASFLQREHQPVPTWLAALAAEPAPRPMRAPRATSRFGIAGLAIAIIFAALYTFIVGSTLLSTSLTFTNGQVDLTGILAIIGFLSIFFIIPFVIAIVFGHIGAAIEKRTRPRASNASGVALILGYVFGSITLLAVAYEVVAFIILIINLSTAHGVG